MTNNQSFELLFSVFTQVNQKSLWVLDENPPANCPTANDNIEVISNRVDVVEHMIQRGYKATFNDFKFEAINNNEYQFVFFRISKEKALAHHIINSAHKLLKSDGQLVISGAKQEGIKGYIDRGTKRYQHLETFKADKAHWAARYQNTEHPSNSLDDKDYPLIRETIEESCFGERVVFSSKPGVFGWNKIDRGSQLLIENLDKIKNQLPAVEKILDIGCGYGYLSVLAAKKFSCSITATDNNAAAIDTCKFNLTKHGVEHQVIAANCARGIKDKFDLVLCNPPFHTGFSIENDLTDLFLKAAKERLNSGGIAIFVVNLHIPLERKAQRYFKSAELIDESPNFKVIALK
jgi:16S rRNA (guanine1207-N2)-methyltransferase